MHDFQLCSSEHKNINISIEFNECVHRRRFRRGLRGRNPTPVYISKQPAAEAFTPSPMRNGESIKIEPEELEALRLVDLEGLSQEEAGYRMGISRGTVWRLLQSARRKVAQALTEGQSIKISKE
ncbi:DUF134 domain-containing protein [Candidatus Bathyarchaeota archaeon]|nr:DUF134 domain-containing protein [Candidatus Bathyarchaeota archaeon]